ncbi:hypothetical protein ACFQ1S_01430 [Kibdelosporangium lantanae]|uniref:Integral membrane protein n=1 Tax=Kibdelosporangium lantanae TaxID=1497396 RepID=A0ABW3M179_9PSEU
MLRIVLVLLGCLLAGPAVVAYSLNQEVGDQESYTQAVTPVVDDPEVRAEIADRVTDGITSKVGLPAPGVQLVAIAVRKFVASGAFRTVWADGNRAAQPQVLALLRGEPSTLRIDGDTVMLDLGAVTDRLKADLVASHVPFAQSLPDVDASVALFSRPAVRFAVPGFAVFQGLVVALPVAAVVFVVVGLVFFRRRRVTVVVTGVGLAVVMLLVLGYQWIARGELVGSSGSPRLAGAFYDALTGPMDVLLWTVFGVGVVLAIGGVVGRGLGGRRPGTAGA